MNRSDAPFVQDCGGAVTSLGNNLISDTAGCGIVLQPTDLTGDAGLGAFTDNGKPWKWTLPAPADESGD